MFVGGGKGGHSALAGGSHPTWVAATERAQQDRAVPAQTTPVCRRKTQSQPHREMVPPQWVILADVLTHCHPSPQSPSSRDRTGCLRGLTALEHWKPWLPHHFAWEKNQPCKEGMGDGPRSKGREGRGIALAQEEEAGRDSRRKARWGDRGEESQHRGGTFL